MIRKLTYKGKRFFLGETEVKSIKGIRATRDGVTILMINKNLDPPERSKVLHGLIKGKNLFSTVDGRRVKYA